MFDRSWYREIGRSAKPFTTSISRRSKRALVVLRPVRRVCYAQSGHYAFASVKERLAWCHKQSLRADFAQRVIAEIKRKGVLVLRLHCSGDFYNADYARKWLEIMRHCPKVRFYLYSRSWRIEDIAPVLEEMAALTVLPGLVQHRPRDGCSGQGSRRRPPGLLAGGPGRRTGAFGPVVCGSQGSASRSRVGLPLLCPHQANKAENCGSCGRCYN